MREIQFRIWDKLNKKMIYPDWEYFRFSEDGRWSLHDYGSVDRGRVIINYEDGVLMQDTGLKDKNGVEIYEGDIIKRQALDKHNGVSHGWIVYSGDSFGIQTKERKEEQIKNGIEPYGYRLSVMTNVIEVIGSIYENPNLLKEQQCEK